MTNLYHMKSRVCFSTKLLCVDLSNDGAGKKNTEKLSANIYSTFSVQKLSNYFKNYRSKSRSI